MFYCVLFLLFSLLLKIEFISFIKVSIKFRLVTEMVFRRLWPFGGEIVLLLEIFQFNTRRLAKETDKNLTSVIWYIFITNVRDKSICFIGYFKVHFFHHYRFAYEVDLISLLLESQLFLKFSVLKRHKYWKTL